MPTPSPIESPPSAWSAHLLRSGTGPRLRFGAAPPPADDRARRARPRPRCPPAARRLSRRARAAGRRLAKRREGRRSAADQAILADPDVRTRLDAATRETVARGLDGYAHDLFLLYVAPWGFAPEEIEVPTQIWHGDEDAAVSPRLRSSSRRRSPAAGCTCSPEQATFCSGRTRRNPPLARLIRRGTGFARSVNERRLEKEGTACASWAARREAAPGSTASLKVGRLSAKCPST